MQYTVHFVHSVSTTVTVEAGTPEQAMDRAYESDDMPGPVTVGAFGPCAVDDDGEWEPYTITDASGEVVWEDKGRR